MRLEPLPANKNTRTGRVQVQSDRQSFGKIVHEESRSSECCVDGRLHVPCPIVYAESLLAAGGYSGFAGLTCVYGNDGCVGFAPNFPLIRRAASEPDRL